MPIPTCATTCNADLPEVDFDNCAPEVIYSEIERVFLAKSTAAAFTDWTQAAEWTNRLSQSSVAGDDYIRPLTVIADKPAPAAVVKQISNGRNFIIGKDHTINYTIDDVSQMNYEFMRALECGGEFKMWYETAGGKMYGGNEGITVNVTGDIINPRGRDEIETIAGTLTWRDKFSPERIDSPIFGIPTGGDDAVYDTAQTFAVDEEAISQGITSTVPAVDTNLKFEFNAINPHTGTPFTMNVKLVTGGPNVIVVSAPSEYTGQSFRFTDVSGVPHSGVFASGIVVLS